MKIVRDPIKTLITTRCCCCSIFSRVSHLREESERKRATSASLRISTENKFLLIVESCVYLGIKVLTTKIQLFAARLI
jgi:hypothetical protein